jgi:hypothetical protein
MPTEHRDYSATPLWKKLGIREGSAVLISGAPEGFDLGDLPPAVELRRRAGAGLDVVVLFVTSATGLGRRFEALAARLEPAGRLWVAWPKKASALATDLDFDAVQRTGLEAGLVDNKSASITEDFQGLQFVYRRKDRPR